MRKAEVQINCDVCGKSLQVEIVKDETEINCKIEHSAMIEILFDGQLKARFEDLCNNCYGVVNAHVEEAIYKIRRKQK